VNNYYCGVTATQWFQNAHALEYNIFFRRVIMMIILRRHNIYIINCFDTGAVDAEEKQTTHSTIIIIYVVYSRVPEFMCVFVIK